MRRGIYPCVKCEELTAAGPRKNSGNIVCWRAKCRKRKNKVLWILIWNYHLSSRTRLTIAEKIEWFTSMGLMESEAQAVTRGYGGTYDGVPVGVAQDDHHDVMRARRLLQELSD